MPIKVFALHNRRIDLTLVDFYGVIYFYFFLKDKHN